MKYHNKICISRHDMNHSPVWLFDLDNTLHNAEAGIFYIINRAMTEYMAGRLKGRKAVFSNGPSFYVRALVETLGLEAHFDGLFGTDDFGLLYKPNPQAYLNVCRLLGVKPEQCIMVDDSADNLHQAKALGMKTVWYGEKAHPLPFADGIAKDMQGLLDFAQNLP